MIVRESPNSKKPSQQIRWPPRSPREAFLSSPSRLRNLSRLQSRISTSPSPSKRRHPKSHKEDLENDEPNDDGAEDEETLQLELKAIEARLKLKRLQKAKAARSETDAKNSTATLDNKRVDDRLAPRSYRHAPELDLKEVPDVHVPLSPTRKPIQAADLSPKRVQLGIDKGLQARNVSLKRASNQPLKGDEKRTKYTGPIAPARNIPQSKSFSERLVDARLQDQDRRATAERMERGRRKGFNVAIAEKSEEVKRSGNERSKGRIQSRNQPPKTDKRDEDQQKIPKYAFTRPQSSANQPANDRVSHEPEGPTYLRPITDFNVSERRYNDSTLSQTFADKDLYSIPQILSQVTAPRYDPPDTENDFVIYGIVASKTTPHTHAPIHKTTSTANPSEDPSQNRSKFMVLHLTDLEWQLDLFIFGMAFETFWKTTVGNVIAILNPGIMPPKPHARDSGAFALKLASSEDTILELGHADDLGWCESVKKDGKKCGQWIDARKTEFCDFHVNLQVEKARAGRMEVNSMAGLDLFGIGRGRPGGSGHRQGRGRGGRGTSGGGGGGRGSQSQNAKAKQTHGRYFDYEAHEAAYVIPTEHQRGLSSAALLDAEDYAQGNLSKAERSRRRLADRQKERELARKLAASGAGPGAEYLRARLGDDDGGGGFDRGKGEEADEAPDAGALGLLKGKGADVRLSPFKGGRMRHGASSLQAMGWSGAFKRGLPGGDREGSPSRRADRESSPVRGVKSRTDVRAKPSTERQQTPGAKKARFMLERKGVRLPGRESLPGGGEGQKGKNNVDDDLDDDDGLDII